MIHKFNHVDDFLGEKSKRFFSHGYKRAIRHINHLVVKDSSVEAICRVDMPGNWSMKGLTPQNVHLSSVDAILIALQLSEVYCVTLYEMDDATRRSINIASFAMKAGKEPLENLINFKASVTLASITEDIITFICHVGGMEIELNLRLPIFRLKKKILANQEIHYESINDILGEPSRNFYGIGFSNVSHDIEDVIVDLEAACVTANVDGDYPDRSAYHGMETITKYKASPIDVMVILSQLIQCYLYLLDGLSRANSSTLWMRAMTFSKDKSQINDVSSAAVKIVRSEKLLVGEALWRCVNVKGHMGDMVIFYSLGHALPKQIYV